MSGSLAMVKCPKCGATAQGGAYCEMCGAKLREAAPSRQPDAAETVTGHLAEAVAGSLAEVRGGGAALAHPAPQVQPAHVPSYGIPARTASVHAPMLAVRAPRRMRKGKRSKILVSFEDGRDLYEKVRYTVLFQGNEVAGSEIEGRPGQFRVETSLNVTPSASGEIDLKLEAACSLLGGETETYGIVLPVLVDDASVGANIIINQGSNTQAGKNEVNISGLAHADEDNAREYLCENAAWRSEFALCRSPRRVTLKALDGDPELVQLLSFPEVRFGRNRPSDVNCITLRVMGPEGLMEHPHNCSVSGSHFRVFFDERGNCCIEDSCSTNGTRLNGEKVTCAILHLGQDHLMAIGRPEMELRMKAKAFRRRSFGATDGLLIERLDSACERIAVVPREIVFPGGSAVLWDGRTWSVRNPSGAIVPLTYSSEVELDGRRYVVLPFDQEEFIHPTGKFCRKT